MKLAHHEVGRFVIGHPAGLRLDVDDDPERAPKPVLEHDKAVLFRFQKTLLLHELFAVKRPAFVEYRRLVHQTRQCRSGRNRIRHGKLEMVARIAFVDGGIF